MGIHREKNTITISEKTIRFEDYSVIKSEINNALSEDVRGLNIMFEETLTVNSSLISFLIKLYKQDNITINVSVSADSLYKMLENLHLKEMFNLRRI